MSIAQSLAEIEYPASDGKPMAETELHLQGMIDIRDQLKFCYRNQRVYVGCNMFVYYVKGDPHKVVAPDVFVVTYCDPGLRRTFKTWEEQRTPGFVLWVTSESTRREDDQSKPETYARIGVKELFLYDPTGDYLDPLLQGYRFTRGRRTRIRPNASGALACRELSLRLQLEDGELRMFDAHSGERLLTEAEAERAQREASDARAEAAEEEVRKLRAQLARKRTNGA
jgi:Uma2 family endonuclease